MMDDLMFAVVLAGRTLKVLTMIFGGMGVMVGFLLLWRAGAIVAEKCLGRFAPEENTSEPAAPQTFMGSTSQVTVHDWQRWFALIPVKIDGRRKWLRFVERRLFHTYDYLWRCDDHFWQYRAIVK
ncbi:hypothetical protein [Bradyrhizobium erythrophlei]|uniref:Uncharacterized protein n=1 Tax=Bradyrhizobium erythrophlei TaxID=1437360 RepID=A0A1M5PUS7_9BRAD|nr:hypothetical protein [Bradyrhizobium erythrophlei]SHH05371.1 hypothetical protein SAMN05443248_3513 [Bradyrhizobium erythrophlei]